MISQAAIPTLHASKYLQQLCKHWGHRFAVELDPAAGRIAFGEGRLVELAAGPEALRVTLTGPDAEGLDRLEQVFADHLNRFAFREELVFDWRRETGDAP